MNSQIYKRNIAIVISVINNDKMIEKILLIWMILVKQTRIYVEDVSYFLNKISRYFFRMEIWVKKMIYNFYHSKFNIN